MINKPVMLITGTRKGIGKYLAEYYTNNDYHVIGCSRNDIDYQLNNYKLNNNKLLIPKQTPKIIKAKAYLKKYNKYNLLNKFNYGGE